MYRIIVVLALILSGACTPRPSPVATPRIAPDILAVRLDQADRLASRGCYVCLKEAAAAYAALLSEPDDRTAFAKALENNLMLAMREIELRMPDHARHDGKRDTRLEVPVRAAPWAVTVPTVRRVCRRRPDGED